MTARRAALFVAAAVVLLAVLAPCEASQSAFPPVRPDLASTTVNVTANFGGWTTTGSGSTCTPGATFTYTAHLFGNASGGTPPYRFTWSFSDGSKDTPGQNTTHIFVDDAGTANLTATDSTGASGTASLWVVLPPIHCPAEQTPPPAGPLSPLGQSLPLLLLVTLTPVLAGAGVLTIILLRPPRNSPR